MKLIQKRTNLMVLLSVLIVTGSLLGAYYFNQPEDSFVSSSSNPEAKRNKLKTIYWANQGQKSNEKAPSPIDVPLPA